VKIHNLACGLETKITEKVLYHSINKFDEQMQNLWVVLSLMNPKICRIGK